MSKNTYMGWIIVALFTILIAYMGNNFLHQTNPFKFVIAILIGSSIAIFLFIFIKDDN